VPASATVVISSGSTIVIDSAWESVAGLPAESVTVTVNSAVPTGPLGVPVMAPAALMASPSGNAPTLMLNDCAPRPPVATIVSL
jgi:hypothetical protein